MKKILIISLIFLCAGAASVNAQNGWDPAPFKHLSLGVGVSTAGADIELATTLGYHFQLRAGLSAFPYTFSASYDMGLGGMIGEIDPVVLKGAGVNPYAIPDEVEIFAGFGLMNGKVLFDIYPFKRAGIHLTAGAYFGNDKLLTLGAKMPQEFMDAVDMVRAYDPAFDFGEDLVIPSSEDGTMALAVKVQKVKPYVGFGLSRAVPKRRIGVNVDCGVMFHGAPELEGSIPKMEELGVQELADVINQVVVYPVISLRLVGRIF